MIENNLALNETNIITELVDNSENYTLIEIGERKYAIETKDVLEIVKVMQLEYPYKMPSYILGTIEFEKKPVGVIDLREVFKNERIVYDLSSRIIVLKAENSFVSIICDKICDIKKINKDNLQVVPYQMETNFFDGMYNEEKENIYVININNIINYLNENQQQFIDDVEPFKYLVNDETSREVLRERRAFLTNIVDELAINTALYDRGVSFCVNNVKYYINMASVKEFYKVNNLKFIKVPNTQDYIYGLVNIKGEYITVLDIRRFYNYPKTEIKEKSTIIILNSDEYKLGILADEICESMDVDFDEIVQNRLQKDETKMMEFVRENEIYQVLDIEKLFKDERLTIA